MYRDKQSRRISRANTSYGININGVDFYGKRNIGDSFFMFASDRIEGLKMQNILEKPSDDLYVAGYDNYLPNSR